MGRGFVTFDRDAITVNASPLTFKSKRTLLFMFLVMHADYQGDKKGSITVSYSHLACIIGEDYFTTRRWMEKLCKDGVITMQKCCKDHILVTINNYKEFQGNLKQNVKMLQTTCKNDVKMRPENPMIQESYKPLINKKEEIIIKEKSNKKEKSALAADASRAVTKKRKSKQTSISDVESNLDTEYRDFALSLGLDEQDVTLEFGKWMDWQDSKGKRFTDNKTAFRNWLRNASKFRNTKTVSIDETLSKLKRLD